MTFAAVSRATQSNPKFQAAVRRQEEKRRAEQAKVEAAHREARERDRSRREAMADFERRMAEAAAEERSTRSVRNFIRAFAESRGATYEAVVGRSRATWIIPIRHDAMLAVQNAFPAMSRLQVGKAFGGRDHATVIHGIKRAMERAGK